MGESKRQACTTTFPARIDNIASATDVRSKSGGAGSPDHLEIACGKTVFGHVLTWNLHDDPHGVLAASTVDLRASTAAHTILVNAARLPMGLIIADFLAHNDFTGYHPWPNVHLIGDDLHAAVRAILYTAELTRTRLITAENTDPILLLVNGIDQCTRLINSAGHLRADASPVVEALRYVHRHGHEVGIHTLLTVDRHLYLVDPELATAPFKAQIGRPADDTSQFLWDDPDIGNTIEEGAPGRGLISTHDGIEQIQWFYTPAPGRERSESDRRILAALRPENNVHPRMVIELPDSERIASWAQVHHARIWAAFDRPDLDPLSPAYRPRRVLPEHLNYERRQLPTEGAQ